MGRSLKRTGLLTLAAMAVALTGCGSRNGTTSSSGSSSESRTSGYAEYQNRAGYTASNCTVSEGVVR